ncbi:response regulator [Pseudoalteromonas sp.]|uniref:response regulator n=1 Tax=Pseudoalteromonas sp. TaxID=53249 RepID=UPI0035620F4C
MKLKHPLAKQLLVGILLTSSLLTLMITSTIIWMDYKRDLNVIDQGFAQIEKSHLPSVTNALWAEDEKQLELLLKGISELPNVSSVAIWQDNTNRLMVHKTKTKYAKRKSWAVDYRFNRTKYYLGELVVVMDMSGVYGYLTDKVVVTLLTQGAKTFIVSLIIFTLVHLLITRHLNQLAYAMSHVNMSRPEKFKLDRKKSRDDEINRLVIEFNEMMDALSKSFSDLKKQKQSEQNANKLKAEFLANISVEVKTPMNGLLGMTHLLSATKLDHRQHSYVNVIEKSAFNMLELLNSVLDFSKIEHRQLSLDQHIFDIHTLVREVFQECDLKAQEKNLRLLTYVDPAITHFLVGDSVRLKQVLSNLVNKAIKYSDRGEINLTVDAEVTTGLSELTFSVRDSGLGIDEDTLARLNQSKKSYANERKNASLGLTITQNLVSLMGGKLTINSKLGLGTDVRFTLGLPNSSVIENHFSDDSLLINKRVLILDNKLFLARYLGELFADWQMQVTHVQDADLALDYMLGDDLRKASFDFVLLSHLELSTQLADFYEKINRHRFNRPATLIVFGDEIMDSEMSQLLNIGYNYVWQLPKHPSAIKADLIHQLHSNTGIMVTSNIAPLTVLIADDAPISQRVLSAILTNRGDNVLIASNGEEAVNLWQQHQHDIDIILMDCAMPKMSGYDAAQKIRMQEPDDMPGVPIIAVTSSDREDEYNYCKSFGIDEVLFKPFLPIELLDILSQFKTRIRQYNAFSNLKK